VSQITFGHALRQVDGALQRPGDGIGDQPAQVHRRTDGQHQQHDHEHAAALVDALGSLAGFFGLLAIELRQGLGRFRHRIEQARTVQHQPHGLGLVAGHHGLTDLITAGQVHGPALLEGLEQRTLFIAGDEL
jgi:hypothetical protein